MATGRDNQLTKQIGEYLVACELARRGSIVATFSGNVPDFDLLATDTEGKSIPIQVKTIRGKGQWQFSINKFIEVRIEKEKQILGKKLIPQIPHLLCVFVVVNKYGEDRFFILEWEELRDAAVHSYKAWLRKHGGRRPNKPDSLHCSVDPQQLVEFENKWDKIMEKLKTVSV